MQSVNRWYTEYKLVQFKEFSVICLVHTLIVKIHLHIDREDEFLVAMCSPSC